ncbi:MAG: dihydrodipicolinate synthase family protein [Pirellulales bacterium]
MQTAPLPQPLQGIIPPMVTPLADRDTLDTPGIERLVDHILAGGAAGLFILGTTGEGPSLGYHLRQQLIDVVAERIAGRVPLLLGITDTAFAESVHLAECAADAGATAVVLAAPCYYPTDQTNLLRYVEDIARELPLPVFLYNMPSHTKLAFELDTVRRAIEIPNVVGLKDSSADMIYFHHVRRLARQRPGWTLLVGPEELLAESVLLGGDGGVCGGANLFPRLYVGLYEAVRKGDLGRVAELHDEVLRIAAALYTVGPAGAAVTAGLKSALACLGISSDVLAEPFERRLGRAVRATRAAPARPDPPTHGRVCRSLGFADGSGKE